MRQLLTGLAIFSGTGAQRNRASPRANYNRSCWSHDGQRGHIRRRLKAGAEAAVADINAKGGVLATLEIGDDACDPKQPRSVAEQLAEKNSIESRSLCSGLNPPPLPFITKKVLSRISPPLQIPKFTDERRKFLLSRLRTGGVAGAYLAKELKDKKVAILHDKTAYGNC